MLNCVNGKTDDSNPGVCWDVSVTGSSLLKTFLVIFSGSLVPLTTNSTIFGNCSFFRLSTKSSICLTFPKSSSENPILAEIPTFCA